MNYGHDYDSMEYQQNTRHLNDDFQQYEEQRKNTGPQGPTEVINNYNAPGAMQGVVQDIDANGVFVNSIQVAPSEILLQDEIKPIIQGLVGRNVFVADIQDAIDQINNLYAKKGYVTARAYLPEQTVQNGNIYIDLIESKVGNITVQNNKWTKGKYITDRMPQDQGELFDIVELEKDVLEFNRYNEGVNLTANLRAGVKPGTTDIELVTHENFPFHLVGVMDNAGRQTTGSIRGGAMLYADSLFKVRDKMSVGSYFSGGAVSPFFDYNIPVNRKDGRVGFMFSTNQAKLKYGSLSGLDIRSRAYQYSLYYSQPVVRKPGFELKTYTALNYKRARLSSDIPILNEWIGNLEEVTSAEIALQMRKDTKYGIWYLNQGVSYSAPLFNELSNYVKINGGVVRLHDFSHGVIGQVRSNYQVIPGDKHIPYLDQFQTGGLATVRGYSEGVMIGKNGGFLSGELMFPFLPREIGREKKIPFVGKYVKGALFADAAGIFPAAREDVYGGSYFLASLGMGLRIQLPGDLSARLYWGYPLINNAWESDRKYGRFHFELTMAPDIDALLRGRQGAAQPQKVYETRVESKVAPPAQPLPPADYYNFDDVRHYDYMRDGSNTSL
jgi:hemolysin activation/secretion protein